jgi:hypothetical protein
MAVGRFPRLQEEGHAGDLLAPVARVTRVVDAYLHPIVNGLLDALDGKIRAPSKCAGPESRSKGPTVRVDSWHLLSPMSWMVLGTD